MITKKKPSWLWRIGMFFWRLNVCGAGICCSFVRRPRDFLRWGFLHSFDHPRVFNPGVTPRGYKSQTSGSAWVGTLPWLRYALMSMLKTHTHTQVYRMVYFTSDCKFASPFQHYFWYEFLFLFRLHHGYRKTSLGRRCTYDLCTPAFYFF